MPAIVGVDVGKHEHQATILDDQGEVVGGTIRFDNSALGFAQFKTHLERMIAKSQGCLVALEATGHYWLPLYLYLVDKGYSVQVFNPYQSEALRRVYLGRAKTDKLDAELVARLARLGSQQPTRFSGEELLSLRTLSRFRMEMVFQTADTKRRIIALLDLLFPEFEKLFADVFGQAALAVLENHPTPEEILALREEKLVRLLSSASKGRLGQDKASRLKQAAQSSVGVSLGSEALVFQLKLLLEQLRFLKKQIKALEKKIANLLAKIDQQLTTIPGVGPVIAATIIGEIGDIKRFPNVGALIAYAGLDPTVKESGTIEKKRRLSKKGSKYLRTAIWQAAVSSLVHNSTLRELYQKKLSEGKPKQVALGALANKLTRIIYGILNSGKPYQQDYQKQR